MTNKQESEKVRRFKATKIKAEQGDAEAQASLGGMYYFGQGVPKNYKKAVKWIRKSAKQGYVLAQFDLGEMYYDGHQGVPKNYKKAAKWYHESAEQNWDLAQYRLGEMYYRGEVGEGLMKNEGVTNNYAEAAKWYRKAAEQELDWAQFDLGQMYFRGEGVPKNYAEAVKWWREAAEQGHAGAQYGLGKMYYKGQGVPKNEVEGYAWFLSAKANGDKKASKAVSILEKRLTAEQIEKGQARAAELHRLNTGEVKWWREGAGQGYASLQYKLGLMYAKDQGVPKNEVEAYAWFLLAKANGHEEGSEWISALEKRLTAEQIEKGQARAEELRRLIKERKKIPMPSVESP